MQQTKNELPMIDPKTWLIAYCVVITVAILVLLGGMVYTINSLNSVKQTVNNIDISTTNLCSAVVGNERIDCHSF